MGVQGLASILLFSHRRPLYCSQPTRVIHHGDINYVLCSSKTKTIMKGLSTGAFFSTKQRGHGGEWDGSAESLIGCDFEGGEAKKERNCIFSTCIEVADTRGSRRRKQNHHKNSKHYLDWGRQNCFSHSRSFCPEQFPSGQHAASLISLLFMTEKGPLKLCHHMAASLEVNRSH